MGIESQTFTGRVKRLRHLDNPRRRRLLVSGQIKPDHQWQKLRFETYEDPRHPLQNLDKVAFELDTMGKPINIRQIEKR